jgi:hypothetical protein
MDITGTVQMISPFNMFLQVASTAFLVLLAAAAVKFLFIFLKSK